MIISSILTNSKGIFRPRIRKRSFPALRAVRSVRFSSLRYSRMKAYKISSAQEENFFKYPLAFRKKMCYTQSVTLESVMAGCSAVGSALDWGSRGREFKSRHSDHLFGRETVRFASEILYFRNSSALLTIRHFGRRQQKASTNPPLKEKRRSSRRPVYSQGSGRRRDCLGERAKPGIFPRPVCCSSGGDEKRRKEGNHSGGGNQRVSNAAQSNFFAHSRLRRKSESGFCGHISVQKQTNISCILTTRKALSG